MKIAIKVTKQAAIRAGLDTYGWHTEEIAAADLTPAERNALAEVATNCKDCSRADFCLDRSHHLEQSLPEYLPTRESVLSSIAALAAVVLTKEQQALAERERAVTEALAEGPESVILNNSDPWRLRDCKGWVADSRLDTLRSTAQRLVDQHNAEVAAEEEREVARLQSEIDAFRLICEQQIKELSSVRSVQPSGESRQGVNNRLVRVSAKITYRGLARREQQHVDSRDPKLAEIEAIEADYTEALAWVVQHGSPRLKTLVAEDIECRETYLEERLSAERPGWQWYSDVGGKFCEPVNPPQEAVDLLLTARDSLPPGETATLKGWTDGDDEDGDWAVQSGFLGADIVMLG